MTLNRHDVRIVMQENGQGEVFLDGMPVKAVHDFTLRGCAGELCMLTMTLIVGKAEIDANGADVLDITGLSSESRTYQCGRTT